VADCGGTRSVRTVLLGRLKWPAGKHSGSSARLSKAVTQPVRRVLRVELRLFPSFAINIGRTRRPIMRPPTDPPSGIDDGAPSGWCDCLVVRATIAIFSPRWIFDLTESAWETRPSQAHARLPLCAQNGPGTSVHGTVLLRQALHYPAFGRAVPGGRDCVVSCGSGAVAWLSTDSRSNASRNTAAARPRSSADIASISRSSLRLGNSS
jgi:hypothetical protein